MLACRIAGRRFMEGSTGHEQIVGHGEDPLDVAGGAPLLNLEGKLGIAHRNNTRTIERARRAGVAGGFRWMGFGAQTLPQNVSWGAS